jgi:Major tropism determinant N-terminal domain
MSTIIQHKRGTAAQWTSLNPTLYAGEFGWESDTNRFKIGNGTTAWNTLPYASPALAQGLPSGGTAGQLLAKIDSTNYNTNWVDQTSIATSTVKHYVKNDSGVVLPKGTVVYTSGANGTNILVRKAIATNDVSSSQVLGFLESELAINASGYCINNGLISNINTNGATAGDPVWLSPTTAGAFITGINNKPHAPNHLVYLGVITRANTNTGEIFVHISNGWELDELHNVDLITSTPADKDLLTYEYSTSLWKNKSFSTLDLLTATTAASTYLTQTNAASTYLTQTNAASTYAPKASPTFTGTPAAPTATAGTNTTQIATTAFVNTAISNVVGAAPAALDTLNELAAAINNDSSFASTVTTALSNKQPLDADLTAIAALSGTSGLLKKTAADTWALDTATYLTSAVTSVGMTVPTGLLVSPSSITSTGTFAVTFDTGYSIPTTSSQTNWNTAYGWGNHASAGYLTSVSAATSTAIGGIKLFSDTVQSVAANAVSTTASRTYGLQINASGQGVINVPWQDTDTNYYPTSLTYTGGTTSGPVATLAMSGITNITADAIPSASATASGIVTTGAQTFAGTKTMTSPSITTSLTTGSTSFDLVNTTATTINFGGAATALNIGGATNATTNIGNGLGSNGTNTIAIGTGNTSTGAVVINIGTGTNSSGTITTTIGNTVKLPQVGTSGFVKLGTGGQLSADTTTYLASNNPLLTSISTVGGGGSEGGQINFARVTDGAAYWYIDSYGTSATPDLRFIENATERFKIATGGVFYVNGSAGTSGQVLTSSGTGSAPTWTTVSGGSFTGGTLTSNLTLAAGTTSLSPLTFQSGTNLTTVTAGAREYDGTVFYQTSNTTPGRALEIQAYQYILSSTYSPDFSASASAQSILNGTTTGITLVAGTTYEWELRGAFQYTSLGDSTTAISVGWNTSTVSGSPTVAWVEYLEYASNTTGFTTAATISTIRKTSGNTQVAASPGASGSRYVIYKSKGTIRVTGTGSIKLYPTMVSSATTINTPTIQTGTFFKLTPLGNGTVTSIGAWA